MFPVRGPEHQRERRWFSSSSTRCRISPPSATRTTEKRQLAQIGHLVVESRLVAPGHPDHLRRQIEPARCQAPLRQERVETVVPAADVPDSDAMSAPSTSSQKRPSAARSSGMRSRAPGCAIPSQESDYQIF